MTESTRTRRTADQIALDDLNKAEALLEKAKVKSDRAATELDAAKVAVEKANAREQKAAEALVAAERASARAERYVELAMSHPDLPELEEDEVSDGTDGTDKVTVEGPDTTYPGEGRNEAPGQ